MPPRPPLVKLEDAVEAVCAKALVARVRETPSDVKTPTVFFIRELLRQTELILSIQLSEKLIHLSSPVQFYCFLDFLALGAAALEIAGLLDWETSPLTFFDNLDFNLAALFL